MFIQLMFNFHDPFLDTTKKACQCSASCKSWPLFPLNSFKQEDSKFPLPFSIIFHHSVLKVFISTIPCDSNLFSIEHKSFKGWLVTFLNLTEICKYPQSNAMKKFYTAHVKHLSDIYMNIDIQYIGLKIKGVSSSVLTPEGICTFYLGGP